MGHTVNQLTMGQLTMGLWRSVCLTLVLWAQTGRADRWVPATELERNPEIDLIVLVSFINYNEGSHEAIINKISYSGQNTMYI